MYPVRRSFSEENGPGTFHSLGVLPKRSHKQHVFHIAHDDDDDDDDHSSSLDEQPLATSPQSISFPTSSPSPPPSPGSSSSSTSCLASPAPLPRDASAPILLSNGKPLKSSLKSSSSSPAMLIPPHMHLRARSEPFTPKCVHFPEKDYGLATVRVYNRSARPAALSSPTNGNGDETETEGEDTPPNRFPFPPMHPVFNYQIDPAKSSFIPSASFSPANLLLESLNIAPSSFSSSSSTKPLLTGSILVRNLAFEKHVTIRFTLDDWQTVSEVGAHYVDSLSALPSHILSPPPDTRARGWDRFTFTIRLKDYAHSLRTRTLWLAARYRVTSTYPEPGSSQYGPGGEWWDNNDGGNYRVGFRPAIAASISRGRPRRETVSAPISSPYIQSPITFKEHALGLMVPSTPVHKEERRATPLRSGKLNLCNYAPPTCRPIPFVSFPSPQMSSPSPITNSSSASRPSSGGECASPASSNLSTPSVSPTIVPRVIVGGQPATSSERDDNDGITYTKQPVHIADWAWSAPGKPRNEEPAHLSASNATLYNAFVTQWCFAQGPSPSHHVYDGGIMT